MKKFALLIVAILLLNLAACTQPPGTTTSHQPAHIPLPGHSTSPSSNLTSIPVTEATVPTEPEPTEPEPTEPEPTEPEPTEPEPTEPKPDLPLAPDFTVFDIHGNPVRLSDFLGTPVVLNFWASWCPPCKAEMPDFQDEYEAHGQNVQFLIVNLTDGDFETMASASAYIAQQGYTFPVFFDLAYSAAYAYQITAIPATYFINAEGYIVAQFTGALDRQNLQQYISLILP